MSDQDYGCPTNEWVEAVRRARLGHTHKQVALMIASYANRDGTKAFPSVARLAVECEIGYSTVRKSLAFLRSVDLVELVKPGNYRNNEADEYRLIIGPALIERVGLPNPDQHKAAIRMLAEKNNGLARRARRRAEHEGSPLPQESGDNPSSDDVSPLPSRAVIPPDHRYESAPITATPEERPPTIETLPVPPADPPTVDPSATQPQTAPGTDEHEPRVSPSADRSIAELRRRMGWHSPGPDAPTEPATNLERHDHAPTEHTEPDDELTAAINTPAQAGSVDWVIA